MGRLTRNSIYATWAGAAVLAGGFIFGMMGNSWSQTDAPAKAAPPAATDVKRSDTASSATEVERDVIADIKSHSEIMKNLTYLCDVIGPRLTSTPALKKANDWTAEKMKAYGLSNVHLESWSLPEGWERGTAQARMIEPDNQRPLLIASNAWAPGTNGKIEGDVVAMTGSKQSDLDPLKGKLKGAIVLMGPAAQLRALEDMEKPGGMFFTALAPRQQGGFGGFFGGRLRQDF